jgi:hypothetical protein
MDGGGCIMNIATNGGFTAVVVLKFTGTSITHENVFDLNNGYMVTNERQNILLFRDNNHRTLSASVYSPLTGACKASTSAFVTQDVWYTIVMRYKASDKIMQILVDGVLLGSVTCTSPIDNRTFKQTHVALDSWRSPSLSGNIAGLFVVDAFLENAAIAAIVASIYAGEDLLRTGHPRLVSTGAVIGHGAVAPVAFVGGGTTVKMQWGVGSIPVAFTICSITRYSGAIKERILNCRDNPLGVSLNWLHGHWTTKAGATWYNGPGNINYMITPNTDWVVACGRNVNSGDGTIVNAITTSVATGGIGNCSLGINFDASSDWQLSKLYIWDYHLSDSDFALASTSLYDSLSTGKQEGVCLACPIHSQSSTNASICECAPGAYAPNSDTVSVCRPCSAGNFKAVSGPGMCSPCPAGTYGGGISCSLCPAGTFSTETSSISIKSCTPCKRGTYNEITGADSSDMCLSCGLGKFHRKLGAGSIDDCKDCNCPN